MSEPVQQYSNHVRLHPPFHYFIAPVLLLHLIWTVVHLVRSPGWDSAEAVLFASALMLMAFLVRLNPLKVQDRLIRLEEQVRYQRLLSPELAARAADLPVKQVVALRFASDAELPALIENVLGGSLSKSSDIKKAIVSWRADCFRV
jgi:hypothetical protein